MRFIALNDGASVGFSDTECSFSTCSSGGTPILTMTVIANHAKMMGTENRWIDPRYEWWRGVFVAHVFVAHAAFSRQKVKALTSFDVLLGFDLTVHHDAAADAVTIALRHDISHGRRLGDRELQRPRQAAPVNTAGQH